MFRGGIGPAGWPLEAWSRPDCHRPLPQNDPVEIIIPRIGQEFACVSPSRQFHALGHPRSGLAAPCRRCFPSKVERASHARTATSGSGAAGSSMKHGAQLSSQHPRPYRQARLRSEECGRHTSDGCWSMHVMRWLAGWQVEMTRLGRLQVYGTHGIHGSLSLPPEDRETSKTEGILVGAKGANRGLFPDALC